MDECAKRFIPGRVVAIGHKTVKRTAQDWQHGAGLPAGLLKSVMQPHCRQFDGVFIPVVQFGGERLFWPIRFGQPVDQGRHRRQHAKRGGVGLARQGDQVVCAVVVGAEDDDELGLGHRLGRLLPHAGIHRPAALVVDVRRNNGPAGPGWGCPRPGTGRILPEQRPQRSRVAGVAQVGQGGLAVGLPAKGGQLAGHGLLGALVFQQAGLVQPGQRVLDNGHIDPFTKLAAKLLVDSGLIARAVQQGQNLGQDLGHYQLLLRQPQRVPQIPHALPFINNWLEI